MSIGEISKRNFEMIVYQNCRAISGFLFFSSSFFNSKYWLALFDKRCGEFLSPEQFYSLGLHFVHSFAFASLFTPHQNLVHECVFGNTVKLHEHTVMNKERDS